MHSRLSTPTPRPPPHTRAHTGTHRELSQGHVASRSVARQNSKPAAGYRAPPWSQVHSSPREPQERKEPALGFTLCSRKAWRDHVPGPSHTEGPSPWCTVESSDHQEMVYLSCALTPVSSLISRLGLAKPPRVEGRRSQG